MTIAVIALNRPIPVRRTGNPAGSASGGAPTVARFCWIHAELNVTVYQRTISDLLLEQTLAPSTGQENRIYSSGSTMRNRGLEASLTLSPVRSRNVNWIFRTTFFANRAKITTVAWQLWSQAWPETTIALQL